MECFKNWTGLFCVHFGLWQLFVTVYFRLPVNIRSNKNMEHQAVFFFVYISSINCYSPEQFQLNPNKWDRSAYFFLLCILSWITSLSSAKEHFRINPNKRLSHESLAMPQKGSKGDRGGERYGGQKAPGASSLMRGSTTRAVPQVAGSDGYWSRSVIFHPFKNCLRSKLSKGHCGAQTRCLQQNFNVISWLCQGRPVQNWNLSPGGSSLTEWLW